MVFFCPLGSGSKGNSLLVCTDSTKVLFDAGLSFKQLKERLSCLNIAIEEIDAVVVTHEHSDHIKGLEMLTKQLSIPTFCNSETAKAIQHLTNYEIKFKIFNTGEAFEFKDCLIHPFSIQHDTVDPVAFTVKVNQKKLGICADIGFVTTSVKKNLEGCDILYIESNHEPSMVHASARPLVYKQRVLGRQGHLSNEACGELLKEIYHKDLQTIYLAHLSEECNHPSRALDRAKEALSEHVSSLSLHVAYQEKVSAPSTS